MRTQLQPLSSCTAQAEHTYANTVSIHRGLSQRHCLRSPSCQTYARVDPADRYDIAVQDSARHGPRWPNTLTLHPPTPLPSLGNAHLHNCDTIGKGARNATGIPMRTPTLYVVLERAKTAL